MAREQWIDAWKGFLILLVVIGHVVGAGRHISGGVSQIVLERMYEIIYSFHMPAFFFIAGYLWHPSGAFAPFAKKKALRLIVPYFVFGFASIVLYSLFGSAAYQVATASSTNSTFYAERGVSSWKVSIIVLLWGGRFLGTQGFVFNSVLWFLPCMFTTELSYFLITKAINRLSRWRSICWGALFVVMTCLFVVIKCSGVVHLPWGLSRLPEFYGPLLLGSFVARWRRRGGHFRPALGFVCVIVLVGVVSLVYFMIPASSQTVYFVKRYLVGLVLIGCSAIFAISLSGFTQHIFCMLGISSLGIMLMHKFIVVACQFMFPPILKLFSSGAPLALLAICIVTVFATTISWLATVIIRRFAPWMIGEGYVCVK